MRCRTHFPGMLLLVREKEHQRPCPPQVAGARGEWHFPLALSTTRQTRGRGQLSHFHTLRVNSPEPQPTGSALLCCLGKGEGGLAPSSVAGLKGRRVRGTDICLPPIPPHDRGALGTALPCSQLWGWFTHTVTNRVSSIVLSR